MKYDFETAHVRVGMEAAKWDAIGPDPAPGVVPLSVADMELLSPPEIIEELKKTAEFGMWGYTWWGKPYADAVKHWLSTRHGWDIQQDWIVQTNGVVQGLYASVRAYTQPTDSVLLLTPVYYPFYRAVNLNGRKVVECPLKLENGRYVIDFDDFEEKAKQCKMFILCSPHNPVGRVWSGEELRRLGDLCLKHHVLVISDEIHCDLVQPPFRHVPFASLGERYAQNAVVGTACSKTFSLAGLCCANMLVPNPSKKAALEAEVERSGCGTYSIFGVRALETGYEQCGPWLDELIAYIGENFQFLREFMARHFPGVLVTPLEGTYLAWLDLRPLGLESGEQARFLEDEALLYLSHGTPFGAPGFERLNLACPRSVLSAALERLLRAAQARGLAR